MIDSGPTITISKHDPLYLVPVQTRVLHSKWKEVNLNGKCAFAFVIKDMRIDHVAISFTIYMNTYIY